ncbi:MAG: hypothetical protein ACHP7D_12205 [Lysobacterales bacterium]
MNHRYLIISGAIVAMVLAGGMPRAAQAASADLDCKLKFSLTGWSLIYKHAEGHGMVTCEDGSSMPVNISAKGGGLTVGKSHIDNGTGRFTDVHNVSDVLGTYAQGDASIGAGKSGTAQVLTKGTVSLALAGAGEGIDIGVSVGGFTISKADGARKPMHHHMKNK